MRLLLIAVLLFISGCDYNKVYVDVKDRYKDAKAIVINNWESIPKPIQDKLKKIDGYAVIVDKIANTITLIKDDNQSDNNSSR